jgi:mono/diheme cytochrome c family protein
MRRLSSLVIVSFCAAGFAQQAVDQASLGRGRTVFGANCGFCHGADARGTDQAPDLARSLLVLSDEKGKELGDFLKVGRADKGMPSFATLSQQQILDLAVFLHERVEAARSRTIREGVSILVGDARAGQAFFNGDGKCATCHSVTGDLKGVGAKYDPVALQDRFVNPRVARGGSNARGSVKVTTPSGEVVSGTLVSVSDFEITLRDAAGVRRSFTRDNDVPKVEINDPLQAHFDLMLKYTDTNMHDLTSYLVTLK